MSLFQLHLWSLQLPITFVEIGPGKTLTGFIKKIAKAVDKEVTTYNVEKYEDVETVVNALA